MSAPQLIAIDLETSGLDPAAHSILEIGACALHPETLEVTAGFEILVLHDWWHEWDAGAQRVHGIPRDVAMDPLRYAEGPALVELLEWIERVSTAPRVILAGMNPRFDYDFLRATAHRNSERGLDAVFHSVVSHRTIDLHTLAFSAALRRGERCDRLHSDAVMRLVGLEPEARPHRAINGARAAAEAIRRLLWHAEGALDYRPNPLALPTTA